MSNINTNGIDTAYPVPGVNNSTQGFRDNFTNIKNGLDTAKSELNDLQSKVIVKSALANTIVNNDMGNTLISNALTKGFRASTYDLGTLYGPVTINVSKGDVQYGTVTEDVVLTFSNWAPAGTQSNVQIQFTIANAAAKIYFPDTEVSASGDITSGMSRSARLLENFGDPTTNYPHSNTSAYSYENYVSVPAGEAFLNYTVSTTTCGTLMDVFPTNRNQTASTIEIRTPTSTGAQGDTPGRICTDGSNIYVCFDTYDGSSAIWGYTQLTQVT